MDVRRWGGALAVAVAAAVLGGAATWALDGEDATGGHRVTPPDPQGAAQTSFPGLAPARGEPGLPGLRTAHPHPGRVATVHGPFDDRFDLDRLALHDGTVTGALQITSDVSDLLELQVLAGFYDRRGALLGTARYVHHLTEETQHTGPPAELERFTVVAPARFRDRVASAAIGVPVLVNE